MPQSVVLLDIVASSITALCYYYQANCFSFLLFSLFLSFFFYLCETRSTESFLRKEVKGEKKVERSKIRGNILYKGNRKLDEIAERLVFINRKEKKMLRDDNAIITDGDVRKLREIENFFFQ